MSEFRAERKIEIYEAESKQNLKGTWYVDKKLRWGNERIEVLIGAEVE